MMLENLVRLILRKVSAEKEISIRELADSLGISEGEVMEAAIVYGFNVQENKIKVSDYEVLIFNLLKKGFSIEEILFYLGWKELESICAALLSLNSFKILKNLRFKSGGRRYEIDVVGIKGDKILLIDCKKWRRYPISGVLKAVEKQLERAIAFSKVLEKTQVAKFVNFYNEALLIPMVVTLTVDFKGSCPVVPVSMLKDFLDHFEDFLDNMEVVKVRISKLA